DEILLSGKRAAAHGGDAEQREVRSRDELDQDALGIVDAGKCQRLVVERGHVLEALRLRAPVEKIWIGVAPPLDSGPQHVAPERDEAAGLFVGQRPRTNAID